MRAGIGRRVVEVLVGLVLDVGAEVGGIDVVVVIEAAGITGVVRTAD